MFLINTKIEFIKPSEGRHYGYYAMVEKQNPNCLLIRAISASGRKRGIVGKILKGGHIITDDEIMLKYITNDVKKKIDATLDLIYGIKRNNPGELVRTQLCLLSK